LGLRSDDIHADLARCLSAGAQVLRDIETGPHELRGVVRGAAGLVVLSQKRASA